MEVNDLNSDNHQQKMSFNDNSVVNFLHSSFQRTPNNHNMPPLFNNDVKYRKNSKKKIQNALVKQLKKIQV